MSANPALPPGDPLIRLNAWLVRPGLRKALFVSLVLLSVLFLHQTYIKAHRAYGNDLTSYLESAAALARGDNPYLTGHRFPYIYPLFLALALIPLTWTPYDAVVAAWFVLSAGSLYLAARILARLAPSDDGGEWRLPLILLCLVFFLDPIQINLLNGQVNSVLLLLAVLFLDQYLKGRKLVAALLLSVAISIKLVPALLLLFLALRREIRMIAVAAGASALLCLLPILVAGPDVFGFYAGYARGFLAMRAGALPPPEPIFFTPYGFIGYLFPALRGSILLKYLAVLVVLGLLVAWELRSRVPGREPLRFAAYLAVIPFLAPMSEPHHLLLAIPGAFLATSAALSPTPDRFAVRGATFCFWACLWLGRVDREAPFYFVALVALLVALASAERAR